ncbi:hypothetical protein LBMAG42_19780 [Deltaproteobacteria bacterium]|nr:hypothetical protein LBMAG42_19780 [Deltaproteobacteria bacterium]
MIRDSSTPATGAPSGAPLLVGPRARSGMQALADRLTANGHPARVFGHPARAPANRDALVGAVVALGSSLAGWAQAEWALIGGSFSLAVVVLLGAGWVVWPRASAWTVIVGNPSAATVRLHTLALDIRRPQRWRHAVAAVPGVLVLLFPGQPVAFVCGVVAVAVCAYDPVRARDVPLEAAAAWASKHVDPAATVLVSTASSGYGEGVEAVVNWFALNPAKLELHLDEEGESGVRERLGKLGLKVPS